MAPNAEPDNTASANKDHNMEKCDKASSTSQPSSDSTSVSKYLPIPPDGGWGWVIVFASFLSNGIVDGMCSTFGIFMPRFVDYFDGSQAKTALAGSLLPGLFLMSGPLASGLVNHYGCRLVTIAGGIIAAAAFIISTFSPNVDVLILTYGVLGGIGLGFIYLPAMVMVSYYFERRRALAMGISMSGSGIGMLFMAPASAALLEFYDWKNALFILSGVVLQSLILGSLMRPLEMSRKDSASTELFTNSDEPMALLNDCDDKKMNEASEMAFMQIRCSTSCVDDNSVITGSNESVISDTAKTELLVPNKEEPESTSGELRKKSIPNMMVHQPMIKGVKDSTFLKAKLQGINIKNWEDGHMPNMSQSCYELPTVTPKLAAKHKNPLLNVRSMDETVTSTVNTSSCYELSARPQHYQRIENKQQIKEELLKPLNRRDVFFSGSVHTLLEYRSQPDLQSYLKSVTVIPQPMVADSESRRCCPCIPEDARSTMAVMMDISVLSNPYLALICVANFFIQIGYYIPIVFLSGLAATVGINTAQAASLISVIGITNSVGRALAGALANIPRVNGLHLNNLTLIVAGVATMMAPLLCTSYATLVIYAAIFGLNIAAFVPLSSIFLVKYLGLEKLTNAFGLLSLVRGFASMLGSPIAGLLLDMTNSFEVTFIFAGIMFILAGMLHYLLPLVDRYTEPADEEKEVIGIITDVL
jgi:MFS family permease